MRGERALNSRAELGSGKQHEFSRLEVFQSVRQRRKMLPFAMYVVLKSLEVEATNGIWTPLTWLGILEHAIQL